MYKLLLIAIILSLQSTAQVGSLDSSYGIKGHVPIGINYTATAFQSDGKLVGVLTEEGDIAIYRFNTDGSKDNTFAGDGIIKVDVGYMYDKAASVAIDPQGKIVVLASTIRNPPAGPYIMVILRYNPDGTPDDTFGVGGVVKDEMDRGIRTSFNPVQVAVQHDGRIVATIQSITISGSGVDASTYINVYNVAGTSIMVKILGSTALQKYYVSSLSIRPDNKITVAGRKTSFSNFQIPHFDDSLFLFSLDSNGRDDLSFGNKGEVLSPYAINANTIAVQQDGKIIVSTNTNKLIRFHVNGNMDSSFGENGLIATSFGAHKIIIQDDGKIIAGGTINGDFVLERRTNNGSADAGFGTGAPVISDFGGDEGIADMVILGNRLFTYGNGILAPYLLGASVAGSETNTISGNHALASNTTGMANTAYGSNALQANTTGSGNTGIGFNSMFSNIAGANNTATGGASLALNTTGSNNAAFGVGAGFSGNNAASTFIGTFADATTAVTNSTALGYRATVNASNQVRIGNSSVTSIGGFTNWTNFSDGRFKKNVSEDVPGLAFISQLRPVTYTLDMDGIANRLRTKPANAYSGIARAISMHSVSGVEQRAKQEKSMIKYTGFVAQEVEQAANKIGYQFSGVDVPNEKEGYYGLRYAEFVVPLVKALQEQQKEIEELKELVAKLSDTQAANGNNRLVSLSNAWLQQNFPNPYNRSTVIKYHIPAGMINAKVNISNIKGQVIRSIDIKGSGDGQITIDAATLSAGTYNYSLWIGGKEVDTKRMVLVR